jgi:hypothetical protein
MRRRVTLVNAEVLSGTVLIVSEEVGYREKLTSGV